MLLATAQKLVLQDTQRDTKTNTDVCLVSEPTCAPFKWICKWAIVWRMNRGLSRASSSMSGSLFRYWQTSLLSEHARDRSSNANHLGKKTAEHAIRYRLCHIRLRKHNKWKDSYQNWPVMFQYSFQQYSDLINNNLETRSTKHTVLCIEKGPSGAADVLKNYSLSNLLHCRSWLGKIV